MAEGDINTKRLALLKFIVVFMGVVLIVGTAALFGLIAYKMKRGGKAPSSATLASSDCKGGSFKVSAPGDLVGASLDGQQALLIFNEAKAKEVIIFNHCTGQIISRLRTAE